MPQEKSRLRAVCETDHLFAHTLQPTSFDRNDVTPPQHLASSARARLV